MNGTIRFNPPIDWLILCLNNNKLGARPGYRTQYFLDWHWTLALSEKEANIKHLKKHRCCCSTGDYSYKPTGLRAAILLHFLLGLVHPGFCVPCLFLLFVSHIWSVVRRAPIDIFYITELWLQSPLPLCFAQHLQGNFKISQRLYWNPLSSLLNTVCSKRHHMPYWHEASSCWLNLHLKVKSLFTSDEETIIVNLLLLIRLAKL